MWSPSCISCLGSVYLVLPSRDNPSRIGDLAQELDRLEKVQLNTPFFLPLRSRQFPDANEHLVEALLS